MSANDALAFIIRAGTAQGRDVRTACHHLLHRNTRKFRLGQIAFKHIRRRYAAKDGSCSGGRTGSGKDQSQVHARAGSQYPLVKHVLPAGFHKLYRYAYRLHGSGRTRLHVRLDPGFCRPGGSGASGRRFFPIHAPFLLALGADMPTRSGSDERATTTAANDRTK